MAAPVTHISVVPVRSHPPEPGQSASGSWFSASRDSYPSEDRPEPLNAVTRSKREYHCVRCLSSPYGRNHRPSGAEPVAKLRPLGSPPHRVTTTVRYLLKVYELVKFQARAIRSEKSINPSTNPDYLAHNCGLFTKYLQKFLKSASNGFYSSGNITRIDPKSQCNLFLFSLLVECYFKQIPLCFA